jgi:D-alanyl-D-alanine carboxypeptidase
MMPSKNIITLGIACFVGLFILASLVLWTGHLKTKGKIEAIRYTSTFPDQGGISFPEKDTVNEERPISAEALLVVLVKKDGAEKILVEKNRKEIMPIASISKLVTALVALEQYRAEDVISISDTSLHGKATSTVYRVGDSFYFSDILRSLLISSHNEIASVLAEKVGTYKFVETMNSRVHKLNFKDTFFVNVAGLDTATSTDKINSSTATDVVGLLRYLHKNYPEILSITGQKEANLFDVNKKFITKITNTNRLLGQNDLPFRIIAGKTGETPRAKQSLAIVAEAPCGGKIFAVLLGSKDRFFDMEEILNDAFDLNRWVCGI